MIKCIKEVINNPNIIGCIFLLPILKSQLEDYWLRYKTGKFKKTRFTMKKGKGFVSAGERGGELRPWAQTTLSGLPVPGNHISG